MRALLAALLLVPAVPARAWDLGSGDPAARAADLDRAWRPFNGTLVDRDMLKRSKQHPEPDWVAEELRRIGPDPGVPLGRLHASVLGKDRVRYFVVGRVKPVRDRRAALRAAEDAASAELWRLLTEDDPRRWRLDSLAPGRDAYASRASFDGEPVKARRHQLDWFDGGKEFFVLLWADKPRAGGDAGGKVEGASPTRALLEANPSGR